MRRLLPLLMLPLVVTFLETPDADADAYNRPMRVKLRSLTGDPDRAGRFVVSYEVRPRNWRRIRQLRIPATVYVYTWARGKKQFRWAAPLKQRSSVWLNRKSWRGWDKISIEIHGAMDDVFLDGVEVKRRFDRSWEWQLPRAGGGGGGGYRPPPDRPVRPPQVSYTALLRTCNRQFAGTTNRKNCVSVGKQLPPASAIAAIDECSRQFAGTTNRFNCMKGGIGWRAGAGYARVVKTCARHFAGTTNRFTCHKIASRIRSRELISVINQCSRDYAGTTRRFDCIRGVQ